MTRHFIRALLAASLVIVAPSLATTQPPAKEPPAKAAPAKEPAAPPAPEITLVSPGTGQRAELRYRPVAGTAQVIAMRMKFDMASQVNGNPTPTMDIPGTEFTMKIAIEKVETNGDIHYRMTTVGIDVYDADEADANMVAAMKSELTKLASLTGVVVSTNRGIVKSGSFTGFDEGNPFMKQMMESMSQTLSQFSSPFPAEPVGAGAQWKVTSRPSMNGMTVETIGTFTVLERTDKSIKLKVDQVISAKEQDIVSDMIPGARMRLKSMAGKGAGSLVIEFAHAMSQLAEISSDATSEMTMDFQGESMAIKQNVKTRMTMTPGKLTDAQLGPASDTVPPAGSTTQPATDKK